MYLEIHVVTQSKLKTSLMIADPRALTYYARQGYTHYARLIHKIDYPQSTNLVREKVWNHSTNVCVPGVWADDSPKELVHRIAMSCKKSGVSTLVVMLTTSIRAIAVIITTAIVNFNFWHLICNPTFCLTCINEGRQNHMSWE